MTDLSNSSTYRHCCLFILLLFSLSVLSVNVQDVLEGGCQPIPDWVSNARDEDGNIPEWIKYLGFVRSLDGERVEHGYWCEKNWREKIETALEVRVDFNTAYWMWQRSGWYINDAVCQEHFGTNATSDCRLLCCDGKTNRHCFVFNDCKLCTADKNAPKGKDCHGECWGPQLMYERHDFDPDGHQPKTECLHPDDASPDVWKWARPVPKSTHRPPSWPFVGMLPYASLADILENARPLKKPPPVDALYI